MRVRPYPMNHLPRLSPYTRSSCQSRYIDTIVKKFGIKNSKRGLVLMKHDLSLSRSIFPKTHEERANMDRIPYASTIWSII